jgi:hypothetical protein
MIYVIKDTQVVCITTSYELALAFINEKGYNLSDCIIAKGDFMKYVSRVTYVDGTCVYNKKSFWTGELAASVLSNFSSHTVTDFLGNAVTEDRFKSEFSYNTFRINQIDGLAGEILYNIQIGSEFVCIFREECVKTDFTTTIPLAIATKLSSVIGLVNTGSFREAKQILKTIEVDAFLTTERLNKYIEMLDAADAIEYATDESYYYKA